MARGACGARRTPRFFFVARRGWKLGPAGMRHYDAGGPTSVKPAGEPLPADGNSVELSDVVRMLTAGDIMGALLDVRLVGELAVKVQHVVVVERLQPDQRVQISEQLLRVAVGVSVNPQEAVAANERVDIRQVALVVESAQLNGAPVSYTHLTLPTKA